MSLQEEHADELRREPVPLPEGVSFFLWPVYRHFGCEGFHALNLRAANDVVAIANAFPEKIVRSESEMLSEGQTRHVPTKLLLRFAHDTWCYIDKANLTVYAAEASLAAALADELQHRHALKSRAVPTFNVLKYRYGELEAQPVPSLKAITLSAAELALNYGDDFPFWEEGLFQQLNATPCGLTLLRGAPGTGKTTFLRHLVAKWAATHRFYFVPVSVASVLGSPASINFWLDEQQHWKGVKAVVILEDAESILQPRRDENQRHVAELLNVADGLMGDCLCLQIIATMNCPLEALDEAVTRPGRLVGYREFRRLQRSQAMRLAARLGASLPGNEDFSLAEIYNASPGVLAGAKERRVGFAQGVG